VNRVAGESQARVTEAKSTYYFLRRLQTQEYLAHLSCASLWVRRAESIENEFRAVVWTSGQAATHDSLADCCEKGSVIYRTIFWSVEFVIFRGCCPNRHLYNIVLLVTYTVPWRAVGLRREAAIQLVEKLHVDASPIN
jgi:hypothetical protein